MAKVLIQDIARELNVSRNTVSKALRNDTAVTENTRVWIAQKALSMGYDKLDGALLDLIRNKRVETTNRRYAILMSDYADDDFWRSVIWGITEAIRQMKGSCILMLTTQEEIDRNELPEAMTGEKVDGVICLSLFPEVYYEMLQKRGYTIVAFDMPPLPLRYRLTYDVVYQDGETSVYEITKDLISRGCNKIGFIGDLHHSHSICDRYNGFFRAMTEAEKPMLLQYCLTTDRLHFYERESLARYIADMGELPDAIVCVNDQIALHVIQILKERGIDVPERVAVTGFDDKRECMIIEPHLTSVSSGGKNLGARLAQQLLWRIENPHMNYEKVVVGTCPVYRESSDV